MVLDATTFGTTTKTNPPALSVLLDIFYLEFVEKLISVVADTDIQDKKGWAALMWAKIWSYKYCLDAFCSSSL